MSSTLDIVHNDVRARRQAAGQSQAALAACLGVSRQTVIAIESGRYDPSLRLAFTIARHFGTSIEEVFRVDQD